MNKLVTMIIPIYNAQAYMRRCIESVLDQTYKELEIILVNDGSTDNSDEIIRMYCRSDNRVKAINKPNEGLSEARNKGMEHSTGDFILFVDSDDYLDTSYVERMVDIAVSSGADIVLSDGILEFENGNTISYENRFLRGETRVLTSMEALKVCIRHEGLYGSPWTAWGKLFTKESLEGFLFPVGHVSEDLGVIPKIIGASERIVYIPDRYYHYILRKGSITNSNSTKLIEDNYYFERELLNYICKNFPDILGEAKTDYAWICMMIYFNSANKDVRIHMRLKKDIKRYWPDYKKSDRKLKSKFLMFACVLFPRLIRSIYIARSVRLSKKAGM